MMTSRGKYRTDANARRRSWPPAPRRRGRDQREAGISHLCLDRRSVHWQEDGVKITGVELEAPPWHPGRHVCALPLALAGARPGRATRFRRGPPHSRCGGYEENVTAT
jgi:hypothetical protein